MKKKTDNSNKKQKKKRRKKTSQIDLASCEKKKDRGANKNSIHFIYCFQK